MKNTNTVHIQRLINKKGFFGVIKTELTDNNEEGIKIMVEDDNAHKWISALKFGADYFYEKYSRVNVGVGFCLTIKELDYQPVDSSFSLFFYLVVRSLIEHTDFKIDNFKLDELNGFFILPK